MELSQTIMLTGQNHLQHIFSILMEENYCFRKSGDLICKDL